MPDHDRHEFRLYILMVSKFITLKYMIEIVRHIFAQYEGSVIEIDPEIEAFAETNTDRRNKNSYIVRYKDSTSFYNALI